MIVHQQAQPEELDLLRRHGLDTVDGAFAFAGGRELEKPGLGTRRRVRLELTDAGFRAVTWYLKCYGPIPWPVRLWRLLTGRGKTRPALREYLNVNALRDAGVPTMRAIICGAQSAWLGDARSYIVVTGVPGEALERCMGRFLDEFGDDAVRMAEFNAALVELAARLHAAGHVHRDLYASHIFLDAEGGRVQLYLIDLARVFAPRWRKSRWRVKDLAQFKYSMPAAWVAAHWDGFLAAYVRRLAVGAVLAGADPAAAPAATALPTCLSPAIDRKVAQMRRRAARRTRHAGP